jgi:hypothetical protein
MSYYTNLFVGPGFDFWMSLINFTAQDEQGNQQVLDLTKLNLNIPDMMIVKDNLIGIFTNEEG